MIKQEDYLSKNRPYAKYLELVDDAKRNNHAYWIGDDDIPVPQNTLKFYNEIKHKRPDVVIRLDNNPSFYNGKGYRVYADLSIAFKDCPDINVGSIGLEMEGNDLLYTVTSDRIKNEKFASYSKGYHIKRTKNFSNAVKNALQYLKPMLFTDMRSSKHNELDRAVSTLQAPARDKMYNISSIDRFVILDEVRNMVRMGYVPTTDRFAEAVKVLATEEEELKAVSGYNPSKCFVWAKKDRVEYQIEGDEPKIVYNLQDVPEEIMNKVSVLQIGDAGKPIMDVGVKIDSSTYWVFL